MPISDERFERLLRSESESHALSAELCKRSLKQFVIQSWHIIEPSSFIDGYVVDAICEHLQAVTFGQIKRLLINIPPRHSKSSLLVIWSCWDWLHHPSAKFMHGSYSLDLSTRDNRRRRILIESPWYQERYGSVFRLASDQNVKRFFENDHQGYHLATSVGGATTGHGGSRLILDDPHSASEAHSNADRNAALRWFREVWTNRLNRQTEDAMITVMQRIHEDDVSGYIIKERPDWERLILPAFYEPQRHSTTSVWTDWRSEEGQLLWPERFSKESLDGLRSDLGTLGFSAQYQQSPVPSSGAQFKQIWFRYYEKTDDAYKLITPDGIVQHLKSQCRVFVTVDLAISLRQSADYTVIATWCVTPDKDLLLLERLRGRLDNPTQLSQIRKLWYANHPQFCMIESTAYQLSVIQNLRKDGLPIREFRPRNDKVARASSASVYYESGKIYHPQGASWIEEWEEEILKFPMASHDDQVDVLSMACGVIGDQRDVAHSGRMY